MGFVEGNKNQDYKELVGSGAVVIYRNEHAPTDVVNSETSGNGCSQGLQFNRRPKDRRL